MSPGLTLNTLHFADTFYWRFPYDSHNKLPLFPRHSRIVPFNGKTLCSPWSREWISYMHCTLILVLYRPVMAQAICHHPLTEETLVLIMGHSMRERWKKWQKDGIFSGVISFSSVRIVPNGAIVYIQLSSFSCCSDQKDKRANPGHLEIGSVGKRSTVICLNF